MDGRDSFQLASAHPKSPAARPDNLPASRLSPGRPTAAQPSRVHRVVPHRRQGPVLAVRYNHSGQYCLSCGKDRTFRLWNPSKGLLIKTYSGHAHEARRAPASGGARRAAAAASLCAACAAAAGEEAAPQPREPAAARVLPALTGALAPRHPAQVRDVQATQDNSKIVSVGGDKQVWSGTQFFPLCWFR